MDPSLRALAVDYDGTLTLTRRPGAEVLAAIREVRERGVTVLLVTGRILTELRADFPDVDRHVDAILAENGAVLSRDGTERALAAPVDAALALAVGRRGVPARSGHVILATDAVYDEVVLEEIQRLGLENQLVYNRGALMVMPHDVSKGSGAVHALAELGISPHNAVGIGDAENDHSLLDVSEIGIAVANAVDALKSHADVVLAEPNGAGIAGFLRGAFLAGLPDVALKRRRVTLGTYDDGTPATIPASRLNIGIHGAAGNGKSYLAGVIAEQIIRLGYTICVLDLEGDHVALATLPSVVRIGGDHPPPSRGQITELLRHGQVSVVVDLSLYDASTRLEAAASALEECRQLRERSGVPHWIVVEEAHIPLAAHPGECMLLDSDARGLCLVSYQPDRICQQVEARTDVVIACEAGGRAVMVPRDEGPRRFIVASRVTPHHRHWHKYASGHVERERRFHFRDGTALTGRSAGNLREFQREVCRAPIAVLRHHAAQGDFSRWVGDLSHDPRVVSAIRAAERELASVRQRGTGPATGPAQRRQLLRAVELSLPR